MRLEKLVLHGFKSFADKTVFEFPKNFTAIVGPNGSGKSNIADAIRWVLGEQSAKTLRAKQSQDVIFGGSTQLSKLGMASVELHLDNSDHVIPLEYEEIVITRKLFRSGESEYRVNNANVRLQDIVLMLAKAKFGQKSYAVIGQGMITHFLNATPQERKLFFDEATGVREHQIKRDQAINKLIRSEEHLSQAHTLMAEIEPHLQSLSRQVKRLEKREKIEAELHATFVEYYGSLWQSLEVEYAACHAHIKTYTQQIASLETEYAALQHAIDALASEASQGERYQQLQSRYQELLERKGALVKDQAVLKGKLELEHQKQGELSLIWMRRKEDELLADAHTFTGQLRMLKEQLLRQKGERDRTQETQRSIQTQLRVFEQQVAEMNKRINDESHGFTIQEIHTELRHIFEEQQAFLQQLLNTQSLDAFTSVKTEAKRVLLRFAELLDQLELDPSDAVQSLQLEMRQLEANMQHCADERAQTQQELNALVVQMETAQTKTTLLQEQLSRVQDQLTQLETDIHSATADLDERDTEGATRHMTEAVTAAEQRMRALEQELSGMQTEMNAFHAQEDKKKTRLLELQQQMRTLQRALTTGRQQLSTQEIQFARIETRKEDVMNELKRDVPPKLHEHIRNHAPVDDARVAQESHALQRRVITLKKQLDAIGGVDQETVDEYTTTQERHAFLLHQTTDLAQSITSLETVIDELDTTIHAQFQKNFREINVGFQQYFHVLFHGGKAQLTLLTQAEAAETPEDVADETRAAETHTSRSIGKEKKKQKLISGIEVMASPPGKKITHVAALSGGEKSMVAMALLCAIIAHNPSPFVFLDEVEAALDEENSEKLSAILIDLAHKTQLIVITHNRVTMRAAEVLFGVTMGPQGTSHMLSVELTEAQAFAEMEADEDRKARADRSISA